VLYIASGHSLGVPFDCRRRDAWQVAPIGVYTSGKGSSAAGLTAAVVKDPASNEFYLEGAHTHARARTRTHTRVRTHTSSLERKIIVQYLLSLRH
jgi:hypothetical protein